MKKINLFQIARGIAYPIIAVGMLYTGCVRTEETSKVIGNIENKIKEMFLEKKPAQPEQNDPFWYVNKNKVYQI